MLAVSPPKSCMLSLLWALKEALEGNAPLLLLNVQVCQQMLEAVTEVME